MMLILLLWLAGAAEAEQSAAVTGQTPRAGAVSGRVETGRGGTVVVIEDVPAGATPRTFSAMVNGRGEFRVFGLPPGRYRLFATSLRGNDGSIHRGLIVPVSHAELIIKDGEDLEGADLIVPTESFTVSGRLADSPETAPSTLLTVVNVAQPSIRLWTQLVRAGTDFRIDGLLPGSYELLASRGLTGAPASTGIRLIVDVGNLTGVRVGTDVAPAPENSSSRPAPVPAPPAGPVGSASGRVVDADTGAPLAGVDVAAQQGNSVKTDANGRYGLRGIPAGIAQVRVDDGLLWPGLTAPRDVAIVQDREATGIDFRVRLFGGISGRVLDEQGQALAGVRVLAIRREYGSAAAAGQQLAYGALSYFLAGQAVTDDRGRYEFERLFAGRQYWLLAHRPRPATAPGEALPKGVERPRTLAATYYPLSPSFETGQPILLRSQERLEFIDIQMRSLPSYCVDAALTRDGQPAAAIPFRVEEEDIARLEIIAGSPTTPAWRQSGISGADGRLRVCGVHDGRFRLTAEVASGLRRDAMGRTTFEVAGDDVVLAALEVARPFRIAGEVVWDVPPGPSAAAPQFRLSAASFPSVSIVVNPSVPGEFAFDAYAGQYGLILTGPKAPSYEMEHPFYIKDIRLGGVSVMSGGLTVTGAGQKLLVTLGADAGSIATRVVDASGRPVAAAGVLILSDSAPDRGAPVVIVRAGFTNAEGLFAADGLPPGRYDVIAVEDLPPLILFRPATTMHIEHSPEALEAIARARQQGETIDVGPLSRTAVTLTSIALR